MKRSITTTGLALLALSLSIPAAAVGSPREPDGTNYVASVNQRLDAFAREPFVSVRSDGILLVDMRDDPSGALVTLDSLGDDVAATRRIVLIQSDDDQTSSAARRRDENRSAPSPTAATPRCPNIPHIIPSSDESSRPYFGCPEGSTIPEFGPVFHGRGDATLAQAIRSTFAHAVPSGTDAKVSVTRVGSVAHVDIKTGVATVPLTETLGIELSRNLLFTAWTNGHYKGATFTLNGTCEEFRSLVGADYCPTTLFADIPRDSDPE